MPSAVQLIVGGGLAGLVIGLTGMGGGALLTPMLVLLFKVDPLTAVSSDLVVSLAIKPLGAAVHRRHGTIDRRIVIWLCTGSIPAAFLAAAALDWFDADSVQTSLKPALGGALVVAATAMLLKPLLARRRAAPAVIAAHRPAVLVAIGLVGGTVVGLTSVGSGSLMIVLLMWTYPHLTGPQLVGTDLAQAIPLVGSATVAHMIFGHVSAPLVGWLVVGAMPGVLAGSLMSSRAPERVIRPILIVVLVASGLKLLKAI